MTKTLKTSNDFISLLNLQDLKVNYDVLTHLQNNIDDYIDKYFKSFWMTLDEVMYYIPENQHKYYVKSSHLSGCEPIISEMDLKEYLNRVIKTDPYSSHNNGKYIINTIEKEIIPVMTSDLESDNEYSIQNDELTIIRKYWKEGTLPVWDGYIIRKYVFDMKRNLFLKISGSYL